MNAAATGSPSHPLLKLFQDLLWPAVAGNVLWSFFTLWIDVYFPPPSDKPIGFPADAHARILVLALLGVYLCYDWVRMLQGDRKDFAWIADLPHAASITVFALMVQSGRNQMEVALIVLLAVTGGGHLTTLWEKKTEPKCGCRRVVLAVINFVGAGAVCTFHDIAGGTPRWNLPIAMVIVLVPWVVLRRFWK